MKIKFTDVSYHYNSMTSTNKFALDKVNFEISKKECLGIIGPTGSGKTTLVQMFTGLLKPTSGNILIEGLDIHQTRFDLDKLRREIGIVFQFPENQLFEETVFDDVAFAAKNMGIKGEELNKRVNEVLEIMKIGDEKILSLSPYHLSEGQKRKVAIAGILSMDPQLIIMDEPTACLDPAGIKIIEDVINHMIKIGKAVIVVSHNLDFIARICQRVLVFADGKIMFDGQKETLFENEPLLDNLSLQLPRTIRFIRKMHEIGYISTDKIYSLEELKEHMSD
ncbi:energy-coupling factor transporter ATPase [candidate division KSB1 bacterium]|nr:energy-coupling factor transporter ATPase [candidate division KSB1 bacterium]